VRMALRMIFLPHKTFARLSGMSSGALRKFSTDKQTIGFIGLGNMGNHMAFNLARAGHNLVVFDVIPDAIDKLVGRAKPNSVRSVGSPLEVAKLCSTIITMLPSSPHVKNVYLGGDGLVKGARAGTLFIDSSTIDPATAREVATDVQASDRNLDMVDAPVSGGVGGAETATLTFMVGGSAKAFNVAKPTLQLMGKNIVHCGEAGTGQVAKVCNNLVLAISMIGVSEALNMGVKLGMDPAKLTNIFNTSSARCWSSDTYNPCPGVMPNAPSSKGYEGGFGVDLMKKDLGLAMTAARTAQVDLTLGQMAYQLYQRLSQRGSGRKDFSFVYEYLRRGDK